MNAVTENTTFQEHMFARIKDSMGDLMTDEELKAITERAVSEAFFKKRTITEGSGYHSKNVEKESMFVEMIREETKARMESLVKAKIDAWLVENPEAMEKAVDTVIQAGVSKTVLSHLDTMLQQPLWGLRQSLTQILQRQV